MTRTTRLFCAMATFAAFVLLSAEPSGHSVGLANTELPPCEAQPTPSTKTPVSPTNLRIVGGSGEDAWQDFEAAMPSGPSAWPVESAATTATHAYYVALASRPDCLSAYSLRSEDQIEEYRRSKTTPTGVTYGPTADPDPRRQDAAKIVIPADGNNLRTQIWLPINHSARTPLLVTWDAWFGKEFDHANTGIPTYKAFQIGSPGENIYTEIQTRFSMAKEVPGAVAMTAIRQYASDQQGPNVVFGPVLNGRNYGSNVIGPMVNEFGVAPEVWTRYWVSMVPQADGEWFRLSMWVADETRGPVQIYDGLQIRPQIGPRPVEVSMDGSWGIFRLEYNTSTSEVAQRGPLVSYARNVVMLSVAGDVSNLLQRPIR